MANLPLSLAITNNPRTWPIIDGRAKADGIDFTTSVVDPSEMFWRQLHYAEFDVSEMSMSSLMMITAQGDKRFYALPVFTTRYFFHTKILVRKDAKIDSPADLKGKRVGVPEYQQTAALWIRGALENEFGVSPRDVTHFMERPPSRSHAGAVGFKAPPGVTINQIPPEKSIGSMMVSGELDACMFYIRNTNLVDRSTEDLYNHPAIKPLFPDSIAEGIRYYRKTGLYPINHGMVIKREVADKNPWAVINLIKAFQKANDIAERERGEHMHYHFETGLVPPEYRAAAAKPIITHGLKANRETLEAAAKYSTQQGLTPRVITMEELFAPNALGS
jgi:4,5-dihydroxyphthalate decarboxylase